MNEEQSKEINNKKTKRGKIKDFKTIRIGITNILKISQFPSGNIIIISSDQPMKIFDKDFDLKQTLSNEDNSQIIDIYIKDDNDFITWRYQKIIIWKKDSGLFKINEIILNAHDLRIHKVIYSNNYDIISFDHKSIKLWSKTKKTYQCITRINTDLDFYSLLLLEDKNMLIFSEKNHLIFYDFITFSFCCSIDTEDDILNIFKLDDNNILFCTIHISGIVSLLEKKVVKSFDCFSYFRRLKLIPHKGIMITSNYKEIVIYNIDNFQIIYKIIEEVYHNQGIEYLKDDSIMIYSEEGTISIFKFILE